MARQYIDVTCVACGKVRQVVRKGFREPADTCKSCVALARPLRPLAERFLEKVNFDGPLPTHRPELGNCWVFPTPGRYGVIALGRKEDGDESAHVVAWFLHYGVWPTLCVLHLCDNRACVRWDHLFEGTHAENMADMVAKGRNKPMPGENNPNHKLTAEQVRDIRQLYADGGITQRELGERFGVLDSAVSRIVTGTRWETRSS
jgi:hypothetical protein